VGSSNQRLVHPLTGAALNYSSNVRKEDSNDTSSAKAYAAKKMKSPSLMLASDVTPCFSLGARPGARHPISRHRMAREPVVLNREGGNSVTMAVDGGRGL
jgi:hypothetical protein